MKRLSIYLGFVLCLLLLGACNNKKTYKIGISQCSSDDWRNKMNEELMLEAMLHDDVEVEIRSANDDSHQQIRDIEYFVDNDFDVIVVAPNEADTLTPEIQKIYNEGVPVVIFDRNINDSSYTQRIGVDNVNMGGQAAEYALSYFPDSIKALEIFGLPNSTPARDRSRGFKKVANENTRFRLLGSAAGNWQEKEAIKVTDSLLKLYPDANLIFAHNDRMALGARKALEKAGRTDIQIIGIDAAPTIGMRGINEGKILATFLYPTEGHTILKEAIKIAKGEPYEREVMLPITSAVDRSNVDILLLQNQNIEEDTKKVLTLKDQLDNYVSIHNAQTALVYAIIAILVLLFGFLFLVLRSFWAHHRHQDALVAQNRMLEEERDKQRELNQKLEEATQSKLVFFTNVSHDLRTPLTLIAEPVTQLKAAENLDNQQKTLLKIADKNVKILQRLINQILDFRKFENNKLKLSLQEIDFNKLIQEWLESFYSVAKKRDIKLILEAPPQEINLAIDTEKIERVFFNLLSNALKYSPDNSEIKVSYNVAGENLVLKVADHGEGISREDMGHIFDRFFQVERVRPKGSGIGLSLAKAFVELHGGNIEVESELKKGTTFTVTIPIRHVSEEVSVPERFLTQEDVETEFEEISSDQSFSDDKPLLLVIDDNQDIREMVSQLMGDTYNVLTASNGKEGIKKASRYVPDLIICDVMMPGMDGMECCSVLKSETVTSHIPVLMLTACSLDEQKVQGFESGADGYISKPFSTEVLKANATSLIANRKRIKDVMGTKPVSKVEEGKPAKNPVNATASHKDIDNDFYKEFLTLFESHIGNADLSVETLASELGFDRTQLYRKIKAITNYSPVELMRLIRLKKARTLLKSTDKTISEICYEVGFSTPAYFSKCYREQYGETPSETRSLLEK